MPGVDLVAERKGGRVTLDGLLDENLEKVPYCDLGLIAVADVQKPDADG